MATIRAKLALAAFPALVLHAALPTRAARAAESFPGPVGSDPWLHRPNDPNYPNMWQLHSHMPPDFVGPISDAERALGAGMHVDRAWQLHTGTPAAVIAILDSGIHWDAADLVDRHFLNVGELPLPQGATRYDANGDGRVSVSDYAADPRVHDANGNGLRDGGDLIAAFSDGVDQDGNGYVDDVAGWDFHEGDNDPGDRTRFGHGTGEAKDSVAALDNGIGGSGICGNCTFIMLRVNDSFVVDANAFARAVIYATDRGATLVQQALGAANWSPLVQRAVDYAYDHDVVVIGSAADEDSYHHNYPSTLDPVVYTNSIRFDATTPEAASSFLAFNNCSNYGARVDVATSGRSCSSEATANLAGISALAWSYANALGAPLKAGELISLMKTTATDIDLGSNVDAPWRHASWSGWDALTGYGRTDAFGMLDAVRRGAVPPEARIVGPHWFAVYANPKAGETFDVTVRAGLPRSGALRVRLEAVRGVETSSANPVVLMETPVLQRGIDGVLTSVSVEELLRLPLNLRDAPQDRDAYTLRLVVDDLAGHVAEARRTVFAWRDPSLVDGFPRYLDASGESGALFADLDGDGAEEMVVGDGAGRVHAYSSRSPEGELAGFPAATAPSRYGDPVRSGESAGASITAALAAGDLDGDGKLEIVAASLEGQVSVVGSDGALRGGFPVSMKDPVWSAVDEDQVLARGSLSAPVLVDLDRDGALEIVLAGFDGQLHVWRADGSAQPGFPLALLAGGKKAKLVSSPAVADVDADGYPDLILGSNHVGQEAGYLFAVRGSGTRDGPAVLAGFPARVPMVRDVVLPTIGTGVPTAPVVADVDGDGALDVVVHAFVGKTYVYGLDGRMKRSLDLTLAADSPAADTHMFAAFGHPAVGDLTGDGVVDPVTVGAGRRMLTALALGGKRYPYDHTVGAWDGKTGRMLPAFPKVNDDMALGTSPIVVDLNGDGKHEVIASSGGYWLHAFGAAGEAAGFPKLTGGWMFGAAAAGDWDGDGLLEIAATTREGYAFLWRTSARADQRSSGKGWYGFKGNNARTGTR
jgi:hypothetical protein